MANTRLEDYQPRSTRTRTPIPKRASGGPGRNGPRLTIISTPDFASQCCSSRAQGKAIILLRGARSGTWTGTRDEWFVCSLRPTGRRGSGGRGKSLRSRTGVFDFAVVSLYTIGGALHCTGKLTHRVRDVLGFLIPGLKQPTLVIFSWVHYFGHGAGAAYRSYISSSVSLFLCCCIARRIEDLDRMGGRFECEYLATARKGVVLYIRIARIPEHVLPHDVSAHEIIPYPKRLRHLPPFIPKTP